MANVVGPPDSARRRAIRFLIVFVLIWTACAAIGLRDGSATKFQNTVPATANANTAIRKLGQTDARNYIEVGRMLAEDHKVDETHYWVLNLWPPGMHLFYATLFTVFGPNMPVGVVMVLAMATLWALLLAAFVDLFRRRSLHWAVIGVTVAAVLLSNVTIGYLFGYGLFYAEGLFTWWLFAALYCTARAAIARSNATRLGWTVAVGATLGLSSYARATTELLGRFMIGLVVLWVGILAVRLLVRAVRTRRGLESRPVGGWNRQLIALILCLVVFEAVTFPWRVIASHTTRPGSYSWTQVEPLLWPHQWAPDRWYRDLGLQWMLAGGPNTACHLEPQQCEVIYAHEMKRPAPYDGLGRYSAAHLKQLTLDALRTHPVGWAEAKLDYLPRFWFDPGANPDDTRGNQREYPENALELVVVIAALGYSVWRIRRTGPDLLALFVPGLFVITLAPEVFFHLEARYFYPLKLVALVGVVTLFALRPTARSAASPGSAAQPG